MRPDLVVVEHVAQLNKSLDTLKELAHQPMSYARGQSQLTGPQADDEAA